MSYPFNPEAIIGYCRRCRAPYRRKDNPDACACGCRKVTLCSGAMPAPCVGCSAVECAGKEAVNAD